HRQSRPADPHAGGCADCLDMLAEIAERSGDLPSAIDLMKRSAEIRREAAKAEREALTKNTELTAELRRRETAAVIDQRSRSSKELELAKVLTGLKSTWSSLQNIREEITSELDWLEPEDLRKVVDVLRRAISDP